VLDNLNKNYVLHGQANGWTKQFRDGTSECGCDDCVTLKHASWSHGCLKNIQSVSIAHNAQNIQIIGFGKYWQSDDFEVTIPESNAERIVRRIERRITAKDKIIIVYQSNICTMLKILSQDTNAFKESFKIHISKSEIGQWLVLEYNIKQDKVHWYFSKRKI